MYIQSYYIRLAVLIVSQAILLAACGAIATGTLDQSVLNIAAIAAVAGIAVSYFAGNIEEYRFSLAMCPATLIHCIIVVANCVEWHVDPLDYQMLSAATLSTIVVLANLWVATRLLRFKKVPILSH